MVKLKTIRSWGSVGREIVPVETISVPRIKWFYLIPKADKLTFTGIIAGVIDFHWTDLVSASIFVLNANKPTYRWKVIQLMKGSDV